MILAPTKKPSPLTKPAAMQHLIEQPAEHIAITETTMATLRKGRVIGTSSSGPSRQTSDKPGSGAPPHTFSARNRCNSSSRRPACAPLILGQSMSARWVAQQVAFPLSRHYTVINDSLPLSAPLRLTGSTASKPPLRLTSRMTVDAGAPAATRFTDSSDQLDLFALSLG